MRSFTALFSLPPILLICVGAILSTGRTSFCLLLQLRHNPTLPPWDTDYVHTHNGIKTLKPIFWVCYVVCNCIVDISAPKNTSWFVMSNILCAILYTPLTWLKRAAKGQSPWLPSDGAMNKRVLFTHFLMPRGLALKVKWKEIDSRSSRRVSSGMGVLPLSAVEVLWLEWNQYLCVSEFCGPYSATFTTVDVHTFLDPNLSTTMFPNNLLSSIWSDFSFNCYQSSAFCQYTSRRVGHSE